MIRVNKGDIALIEGSIRKWEKVIIFHESEGKIGSDGCAASDCPLCKKYHWYANDCLDRTKSMCKGCPIKKDTGRHSCRGTPFGTYNDLNDEHEDEGYYGDYHAEALELAKKMLSYLVELKYRCEEGGE